MTRHDMGARAPATEAGHGHHEEGKRMKMTEAEYRNRAKAAIVGNWTIVGRMIDDLEALAVAAGVEFAAEPVEPKVGDQLTDETRLVDGLGVVDVYGVLWQYEETDELWRSAKGHVARVASSLARIVYVPEASA